MPPLPDYITCSGERTICGLDPSFKTMGLALYDPTTRTFIELATGTIDQIQEAMLINKTRFKPIYVLEDPNQDGLVYQALDEIQRLKGANQKRAIQKWLKIAQDVGKNKAAASRIIEFMHVHNLRYLLIPPSCRHKMEPGLDVRFLSMPTKVGKRDFERLTGCTKQSSEHSRDAATLVYDRTVNWVERQIHLQGQGHQMKPTRKPRVQTKK